MRRVTGSGTGVFVVAFTVVLISYLTIHAKEGTLQDAAATLPPLMLFILCALFVLLFFRRRGSAGVRWQLIETFTANQFLSIFLSNYCILCFCRYHACLPGWYPILTFEENIGTQTAYDYYVAHKGLSNFTREIPVMGITNFYFNPSYTRLWYGQNCFSDKPTPPDTYYIYCIAFGQVSKPFNLTVISVLWD